jgi:hypothetical protein
MIKYIICYFKGHILDWPEYDKRIRKEDIYAAAQYVWCNRCKNYIKYKNDIKRTDNEKRTF